MQKAKQLKSDKWLQKQKSCLFYFITIIIMIINTKFRKTAFCGLQVYLWSSAKPIFEWMSEWMICLCLWLKWRKSRGILNISVSTWVSIITPMLKRKLESSSFPSCFLYESFQSSPRHSGTPKCPWCKAICECVGSVISRFSFPVIMLFGRWHNWGAIRRWTFSKLQNKEASGWLRRQWH